MTAEREIGWKLVAAMDDAGVSVNELCRRTGLSRRTIVNMRSGRHRGSIHSWMLAADALGMTLAHLLEYR